jgi:DNA-binding beta-propeller fold protein YncE
MPGAKTRLFVFTVVLAFIAAACSGGGGVSQEDYDALEAELATANEQVTSLTAQLSEGSDRTAVVQAGQLAPAEYNEIIPGDGWANTESVRGGLWLVATFDDSGPDAWDVAAHPRVYFTSESFEPANPAQDEEEPFFSGYHVIDAVTHEVLFDFVVGEGGPDGNIGIFAPLTRGPHGVGVSPDGKWMYVGWSETGEEEGAVTQNYIAAINIRTGKIYQLFKQESYFQFGMRGQAIHHIQCWTDVDGNDRCIFQWGFGANGGPHHIIDPNDDNRVVRSITYDDVKPMGHPFTTPSPDGKWVYISMGANSLRESFAGATCVAKVSTDTPEVIEICDEHGRVLNHPIGITHTMDGLYTYVVDGSTSMVVKIDNVENEVIAHTSAGVAGPYGICLNKDETIAFIVGKGEGSHNTGSVLGLIDLTNFSQLRADHEYPGDGTINPLYLGGSAASVDHCALNPDLDANEIWVSNMRGWETIVVNYTNFEVTDYIPTPNGGDTHGMAFVNYNSDWTGELMTDMGGPKSKTLQAQIAELAAAAAAAEG